MSATQKNKTHKLNEKIEGQEIRCYDNGGKTVDRFTVVFMNQPENVGFMALGMNPFTRKDLDNIQARWLAYIWANAFPFLLSLSIAESSLFRIA